MHALSKLVTLGVVLIGSLALAGLTACGGAAVDIAAEQAAVQARSTALAAAEAAQNTDSSLMYWADDAVVQPAGVPQIEGKEGIRALYDGLFGSGQLRSFEGKTSKIVVADGGGLAYEYGVNRMVLAGPQGDVLDVGKYLAVWTKMNGTWFAVALSFTSDAPTPVQPQTNSEIGTWKLNVAKSTYSSGPGFKNLTLVFEAAGQGVKGSMEGVNADGSKYAWASTANYDGTDVPLTGSAIFDTVSLKRINATTVEETRKKGSKVVRTLTRVVSADGKSFTVTVKGTNDQGHATNNVEVYEKQ